MKLKECRVCGRAPGQFVRDYDGVDVFSIYCFYCPMNFCMGVSLKSVRAAWNEWNKEKIDVERFRKNRASALSVLR